MYILKFKEIINYLSICDVINGVKHENIGLYYNLIKIANIK